MKTRFDDRYEHDITPSRESVERYRAAILDEDDDGHLALVHYRGTETEHELGLEYAASADPLDRVTGAHVLSQLGWKDRTFLEESVDRLILMLQDSDTRVVAAAAGALGHRSDPRAIPDLVAISDSTDPKVRWAVVRGLSGHEGVDAVRKMIELSADPDREVRNWATFGLGSLIQLDTPEIRAALVAALADPDHEIRGEGLVGLAIRKDSRVVDALLEEWEGEDISRLSLEAAAELGDPRLVDRLEELRRNLGVETEENPEYRDLFRQAIDACGARYRRKIGNP